MVVTHGIWPGEPGYDQLCWIEEYWTAGLLTTGEAIKEARRVLTSTGGED